MMAGNKLVRLALVGLFGLATLLVGGCGTSQRVDGRVVLGKTGVVTIAGQEDPRFDGPGARDVRVRVLRPGDANTPVAEATTGPNGDFSLRVSEEVSMAGRLEIVASGPGVLTCRGSVYLPRDGRWVLVFVEPAGGGAAR